MPQARAKITCIIGTRPEFIKMAPVIRLLQKQTWVELSIINTGQHKELLQELFTVFDITPNQDLAVMQPNQSLCSLTSHLCLGFDALWQAIKPDLIVGVGDTSSVFVAALSAFYQKIPFAHIEAGLRSHIPDDPFPEEMNRVLVASLARLHFAPTMLEANNLMDEHIPADHIFVTGNPVIDCLMQTAKEIKPANSGRKSILITSHRRENFGTKLLHICKAIELLAERHQHVDFIFPVHPNPNVQTTVQQTLAHIPNVRLCTPLPYPDLVQTIQSCYFVMTDSGGLQEEAPALGKPVLVLRDSTERPAIIEQGLGLLVGTDTENIVRAADMLLTDKRFYHDLAKGFSPYGDGHAAERIVAEIQHYFAY